MPLFAANAAPGPGKPAPTLEREANRTRFRGKRHGSVRYFRIEGPCFRRFPGARGDFPRERRKTPTGLARFWTRISGPGKELGLIYISPNSFPRPALRALPSVPPVDFLCVLSGESRLFRPETPKTRGSGSRLANTPVPFRFHSNPIRLSLERGDRFPGPRSGKCRK